MAKASKPAPTGPAWIADIFTAQQVKNGGVVRRSGADFLKYASFAAQRSEVRKRGFHMLRTGDQYVILCHKGELRIVC